MPLPLDDLASFALFAHVVEERSFTGAARRTGLAKSAVSTRVAKLEERLGVRLLHRTTRKLSLTEEGVRFYEHCARMLAAAGEAEAAVAGASGEPKGTIRVSAPVTLSQMHLASMIAGFLAEHRGVEVHLTAEDRLVDVVEGGYDVVVRITRLSDSSLVAKRLAADRLVVCGSPAYLARAGTPEAPADLVDHNCLHYSHVPRAGEWRFRGPGGMQPFPVRGNFTASDGTVLRRAALEGLGLAVLPSFMVAPDLAAGRLVTVLEGFRRAEIGIYAVYSHRNVPTRVRALLDFLAARFGRARWALHAEGEAE